MFTGRYKAIFKSNGLLGTALLVLTATASAQFAPISGSPFPAGTYPTFVAVGDFNGDGKNDLAFPNETSNTVTVLLSNLSGGFTAGTPVTVGYNPIAIAVGDFNHDGKLDMAVVNQSTNNVTIMLGNGSGGFSEASLSPVAVGMQPGSIVAADFNNDGTLDLAVANTNSNTVSILVGNGTGGFTLVNTLNVGSAPRAVVVGDFNNDGKLDLAVANATSGTISILLGNNAAAFTAAPGSPYNLGGGPTALAVADFDGDGNADLAVVNKNANNVSILLGNGSGALTAASGSPYSVGLSPIAIAVGDFNTDGNPDLAVANTSDNTLSILMGTGSAGGFTAGANSPYQTGTTPTAVAVADFDGNGTPDLAIANAFDATVKIMANIYTQPAIGPTRVTPGSGSGNTKTFTFTYTNPAGYANITVTDTIISTFLDGQVACYFAVAPTSASTGYIYLVDDAGDGNYAPGTPMPIPSNQTLANSQCSISGAGTIISGSGNTLTITMPITFPSTFAGNKAIYTAARNNTQNSGWQALGTWDVPGSLPAGPQVTSVSPARGTSMGQNYTFTFNDTNGYADLLVLDVLNNSFLDGVAGCYFAYVPGNAVNGYVYLVDDAGDGGYAPGSPLALSAGGTLQNSQCILNLSQSSASASGNTLSLNMNITYKAAFAGNQVFFLSSRNSGSGNSGWQAAGSVKVP